METVSGQRSAQPLDRRDASHDRRQARCDRRIATPGASRYAGPERRVQARRAHDRRAVHGRADHARTDHGRTDDRSTNHRRADHRRAHHRRGASSTGRDKEGRAKRLAALVVAAGALMLGGCQLQPSASSAAPASATASHLFSANAGFDRTTPITVQASSNPNVALAVSWWNDLAGRAIFTLQPGASQVTTQADTAVCAPDPTVACAAAFPVTGVATTPAAYPYRACAIYVKASGASYWEVYAHELGHCLGFDHVVDRASVMNVHADMSNRASDRLMLQTAGYASGV
jgi:hypothetical protein